jgi:autotransporter-associated beta strand protein/T5SS/PEP-CTERM-associated repeat protein
MTITGGAAFNVTSGAYASLHAFIPSAAGLTLDGGSTVTVTGTGSQLIATTNSPQILVGYNTTGSIAVSAGGFINATSLTLGNGAGSTGTATVDGNSTLSLTTLFIAGLTNNTGSVTITNGGTVKAVNPIYFGSNASSISISTGGGTLTAAGISSNSTGYGSISLTDPTGGYALNINAPSGVTSVYSGSITGTGSLNMSGSGMQTLSGTDSFTGSVLITGGTLGLSSANHFSQLTVQGAGALELNSGGALPAGLAVNLDGGALVCNASGGTVSNPINLTSNGGTVNVSSGSTLTTTGNLNGPFGALTKAGPGTLNLALSNSSSNAIKLLTVSGGLAQLSSGALSFAQLSNTSVLQFNNTTLNVSGGSSLTIASPYGYPTDVSNGTVNVVGSSFSQLSMMRIGLNGSATLNLSQPGTSTFAELDVGTGATGNLSVLGGATLNCDSLALGDGATGFATVNGSGSVINTGRLDLAGDVLNNFGVAGTLTIVNSGQVNASGGVYFDWPGSSSINISGGTLNAASLSNPNGGGTVQLADPSGGGFALNLNAESGTSTYSGAISGSGSLNKSGGSTQILSGNDTFTGSVQVNGGTLILNSPNSISSLNVNAGLAQVSAGSMSLSAVAAIPFLISGPTASLNLSNGAVISATSLSDSSDEAGRIDSGGTVNVIGAGSLLNLPANIQRFDVGGYSGASVLNLTGGGMLNATYYVSVGGLLAGAGGTLNVGPGSSASAFLLSVGLTSGTNGIVNINGSGATLTVYNTINLGQGAASITVINGGAINAGEILFGSNSATLNISGGAVTTPFLESNFTGNGSIILCDPPGGFALTINGRSGDHASYSGSISGTGSLDKSGQSVQTLAGTNTFTGSILVAGGVLALQSPIKASTLVIAGGTVQITGTHNVLTVPTLAIVGSGVLDLTNNSADISASSLTAVTALVQRGYSLGTWNGSGITSSNAAADTTHLTAVGVIQNNQNGTALYTASHPFEGTTPGASDILAKYTYYGDTNLDGKVDSSDYTRIDSAYLADKTNPTSLTGWFNGDFNYDGVTNGSDYTLIDNAFNTQGAQISAQIATPTAQLSGLAGTSVPEPAGLGVIVICAISSLGGRARQGGGGGARSKKQPY